MTYAAAPFTFTPTMSVEGVALPAPYDYMDIKDIEIDIIKTGSNDSRGRGYANSDHQIANYSVSNATTRKSGYSTTNCIYIQEYNGSSWVDKVVGTVDLSVAGEMTFSFPTYRDSSYHIQGIARGEI